VTRAVVFAYHDVGVRGLEVLRAAGVDVRLLVTHEDDPDETVWFGSVAARARLYGIPVVTPADPNGREMVERVRASAPDLLFSFYYRRMLGAELLALPRRGAYNLHGSLLPKYRGRAPVNWAILRGERETGATLHEMVAKPDAGRIVDRERVPILLNDIASEVLGKVALAGEIVLERSLPALAAGTAALVPQDLAAGSYFGGRRPEDGAIDPAWPAKRIHDLVRAVAPPYPGAFLDVGGRRLRLLRTFDCGLPPGPPHQPALVTADRALELRAADGGRLVVLEAELDGVPLDAARLRAAVGPELLLTGDS
jgi:methionyl-tRNA formyltransferase